MKTLKQFSNKPETIPAVTAWYLSDLGEARGRQELFTKQSPQKQKSIEILVDQILAAKKKDPKADTSTLEKQIDEMVYALYGLTPEEIAIVEGKII